MEQKRVLVGMSGGVDSSVSAALLVEQGHEVEGVFLKVWSDDDASNEMIVCPWESDLADARAVADQLGIPLHIKNVQREYFEQVVEVMKAGYARGETPNPDVLCNSEVKFGILYDWAMEQGFDFVATGHYARIRRTNYDVRITEESSNAWILDPVSLGANRSRMTSKNTTSQLQTAVDTFKDQTYFLWRVPKERFEHILFPIGHLTKPQVRAEAIKRKLPNAKKPDSQGVCFLGKVDVRSWLKRELETVPGPVITKDGTQIGTHAGAQLFTIGQRHGLGTAGGTAPYYVVEKNILTNTIVVDTKAAANGTAFEVDQVRWFVPSVDSFEGIDVRIRHQGERIPATIHVNSEQETVNGSNQVNSVHCSPFTVHLDKPAFGIARGQSVVFYRGTSVLGGGIIS